MGCNFCDDCSDCTVGGGIDCGFFEESNYYRSSIYDDSYDYWSDSYVDYVTDEDDSDQDDFVAGVAPDSFDVDTEAGISWKNASAHIGEKVTVCGPVVSTFHSGYQERLHKYYPEVGVSYPPTFIRIGADYASREGFQLVVWGSERNKFPETLEMDVKGKAIYAEGYVRQYNGLPEIVLYDLSQITVVDMAS